MLVIQADDVKRACLKEEPEPVGASTFDVLLRSPDTPTSPVILKSVLSRHLRLWMAVTVYSQSAKTMIPLKIS